MKRKTRYRPKKHYKRLAVKYVPAWQTGAGKKRKPEKKKKKKRTAAKRRRH